MADLEGMTGTEYMLDGKPASTKSKIKSAVGLLVAGLLVVFAPYIAFAVCSSAVLTGLGGAIAGMSISGMLVTFVTYMCADFLSNFLQHPVHKMDYGAFNRLIGRDMGPAWWGTRTEHIVGVAICLALLDHFSQGVFAAYLGEPLDFETNPAAFVAHTWAFIYSGVALFVLFSCALNPNIHEEHRWAEFMQEAYACYVGANTAWFEPFAHAAVGVVLGKAAAATWLGGALFPATLAYSTVKGVGWTDWGEAGLSDHEKKINGI